MWYSQLLLLQMEQMGALIGEHGGGEKGILIHLLSVGRKFSVQSEVIPQKCSLVSLYFQWIEAQQLLFHLLHVRALGMGRSVKLDYIVLWLECYQLSIIFSPYSAVIELKGVTEVATRLLVIFLKWYFPTLLMLPLLFQYLMQSPSTVCLEGTCVLCFHFFWSNYYGHITLESFCFNSYIKLLVMAGCG